MKRDLFIVAVFIFQLFISGCGNNIEETIGNKKVIKGTFVMNGYYGGKKDDWFFHVIPTEEGYIGWGYTQSYGEGFEDVLLVDFDKKWNIRWMKTYGTKVTDVLKDLKVEGNHLYLAGYFYPSDPAEYSGWLAKIRINDGSIEWVRKVYFNGTYFGEEGTLLRGICINGDELVTFSELIVSGDVNAIGVISFSKDEGLPDESVFFREVDIYHYNLGIRGCFVDGDRILSGYIAVGLESPVAGLLEFSNGKLKFKGVGLDVSGYKTYLLDPKIYNGKIYLINSTEDSYILRTDKNLSSFSAMNAFLGTNTIVINDVVENGDSVVLTGEVNDASIFARTKWKEGSVFGKYFYDEEEENFFSFYDVIKKDDSYRIVFSGNGGEINEKDIAVTIKEIPIYKIITEDVSDYIDEEVSVLVEKYENDFKVHSIKLYPSSIPHGGVDFGFIDVRGD